MSCALVAAWSLSCWQGSAGPWPAADIVLTCLVTSEWGYLLVWNAACQDGCD